MAEITEDGWGVGVADLNSSEPIIGKICSSIDGKPVVSMTYMFTNSLAPSVDFSDVGTSQVTNMWGIFYSASNIRKLDLNSFDFSNLGNYSELFSGVGSSLSDGIIEIDLSNTNFDVTKVTTSTFGYYSNVPVTVYVKSQSDADYLRSEERRVGKECRL